MKENSWQVENRTSHRGKICSHSIFVSDLVSFLVAPCGVLQASFAFPPLRQDGRRCDRLKDGAALLPTFLAKRRVLSVRPREINTALAAWTKWRPNFQTIAATSHSKIAAKSLTIHCIQPLCFLRPPSEVTSHCWGILWKNSTKGQRSGDYSFFS